METSRIPVAIATVLVGTLVALWAWAQPSPSPSGSPTPGASPQAAVASPIELVQSIPVETDLAQPDLAQTADVWMRMIEGARKSIDLSQFYMSPEKGKVLDPIIDALEAAAKRGVKIRILVSNVLLKDYPEAYERLTQVKNVSGRVYDLSKVTGGILHTKYWIVDGREVFVGSQNFDWRALIHIHETGLRITSPKLAAELKRVFDADWKIAQTGARPKGLLTPEAALAREIKAARKPRDIDGIELVAAPPSLNPQGIRSSELALLELLGSAKEKVQIQLLDYSPLELYGQKVEFWPVIDNALRAASVRGVKVELLVSHWNDKQPKVEHLKSLAQIPGISVRIATIPAFSGGEIPFARVIHSKLMVVDSKVLWLGTSNWSKDYFRDSRNVELILKTHPELALKAQAIFEKLWTAPITKGAL